LRHVIPTFAPEANLKKQRKFLLTGAAVVGLVGYLGITGMEDSMVYYHTPSELVTLVAADPAYAAERGVKVGGRVVPGTVSFNQRTLDLTFEVVDVNLETGVVGTTKFPVTYQGPLPETFQEGSDVVAEGTFTNGTFQATTLLTKCGSRYEAGAEDYLT
jgi:cytochrome c-type biogenesis protein CcmE